MFNVIVVLGLVCLKIVLFWVKWLVSLMFNFVVDVLIVGDVVYVGDCVLFWMGVYLRYNRFSNGIIWFIDRFFFLKLE